MANYIRNNRNFKVGVTSFSESKTSLIVVGNVSVSGSITATSFKGDGSQLTGVVAQAQSSIGLATYASIAGVSTSVIGGIGSITQLSVSGVSTLGVTSTTNLTAQQLNVSGISTFAGITTITGSTLFARQLSVSGVSTFTGISTFQSTLFGTQASFTGVVTASSFRGDGSQLTGIVAQTQSSVGVATYALTSGVSTSVIGGIGSITQLNVSGVSTFQSTIFGTQLNVSGVSTLGTLSVNQSTITPSTTLTVAGNLFVNDDLTVNSGYPGIGAVIQGSNYGGQSTGFYRARVDDLNYGTKTEAMVIGRFQDLASYTLYNDGSIRTIGDVSLINGASLNVSGVSTFTGISTFQSTLFGTQASFTGVVTASSFVGSGSSLTNLPAGQLTGALPALDGSALIGVVASGTGIVVKDDNVTVGTAGTLNFGTGLDVIFASGTATINASGTGSGISTYASTAGVSTYALTSGISTNVIGGIGSITQLSVSGVSTFTGISTFQSTLFGTQASFTGVVTASSFRGSGSSLTGIVTYITAGSGISVNQNTGNVTITASAGALGIATYADIAGIATYAGIATSVVSGVASVTQLQVTGFSTFRNGPVLIGIANSTGTSNQALQVGSATTTLGAYIAGSVGIGTTNPREKLDVFGGNIGIQGVGSTSRFYIQHNTAQNSLDFVFI